MHEAEVGNVHVVQMYCADAHVINLWSHVVTSSAVSLHDTCQQQGSQVTKYSMDMWQA
jgi:hypothetical protein